MKNFKIDDNLEEIFKVVHQLNEDKNEEEEFTEKLEEQLAIQNQHIQDILELLEIRNKDEIMIKDFFKQYRKEKKESDYKQEKFLNFLQFQAYSANKNRQMNEIMNHDEENNIQEFMNKNLNYQDKVINDLVFK